MHHNPEPGGISRQPLSMKMKPDKMLYEKASSMARKMDETYNKMEECAKMAAEYEKAARINYKIARDYADVAKSEHDETSRIAFRAAIMHAVAIVVNTLVAGLTAAAVCIGMLE